MINVMLFSILLFFLVVVLKLSLEVLSFWSCVFREYAFRTWAAILTASCFLVSFDRLQILLNKTLWCCLLLSQSNIFDNFWVKLFQPDWISIGKNETFSCAASSSVVCISAVRLWIQIWLRAVFMGYGPIFKITLAVTGSDGVQIGSVRDLFLWKH